MTEQSKNRDLQSNIDKIRNSSVDVKVKPISIVDDQWDEDEDSDSTEENCSDAE